MIRARAALPPLFLAAAALALPASAQELRPVLDRYQADRGALSRRYPVPLSRARAARMRRFYEGQLSALERLEFVSLSKQDRVDFLLFENLLEHELRRLEHEARRNEEVAELLPFADVLVELAERRRNFEPVDARAAAGTLDELAGELESLREALGEDDVEQRFKRTVARRAAQRLSSLRDEFADWYRFHSGYDPLFSWWVERPYAAARAALEDYEETIEERLVRSDDEDSFLGDPIGRAALLDELAFEMIAYTPEELIAIAEREFAWCEREMLRASNDLGFGDDWKRALDHVKDLHVEPGEQPEMIRELALEAIEFLEARDLITIPELAKETWRMEMMSPERQKTSPYFLGGETILVSYPTDEMEHADKLMSMRGNNRHFARATVHHELIPGHHLQGFMTERHKPWRRLFATPFWTEGWALYWELLLWDLEFAESPENRVGMLFWRTHRCARIVFSLRYHLGEMTEQEAIDFLVERVGHERNNATAEVRRSVSGSYGPLYQCAYMLGGLQLRALRGELVASGEMTDREFHDAVLREGRIPIEMLRATLTGEGPARDFESSWRFDG